MGSKYLGVRSYTKLIKPVYIVMYLTLGFFVFYAGCNMAGVVGTPTFGERKIPAEFDLKERQKEGILVLIDESRGSGGGGKGDYAKSMGETVSALLVKQAKIQQEYLSVQTGVLAPASGEMELSPVAVGKAAGKGMVLYVWIIEADISPMGQYQYFSGDLKTRSMLFDVQSGRRLWPQDPAGRLAQSRVEMDTEGYTSTFNRLIRSNAHIITRRLYDCPKDQIRVQDEMIDYIKEFENM